MLLVEAEGGVFMDTRRTLPLCLSLVTKSGSYLFLGVEAACGVIPN
jgi:hypothetical protein